MKTRAHVAGSESLEVKRGASFPPPLRIGTRGLASFQTDKGRRN